MLQPVSGEHVPRLPGALVLRQHAETAGSADRLARVGQGRPHVARSFCRPGRRLRRILLRPARSAKRFASALAIELAGPNSAKTKARPQLNKDGLRLLAMFAGQIAPQLDPAALETRPCMARSAVFTFAELSTCITRLSGIVDLKTITKKPGALQPSYELQLVTYGLLAGKRQARLITMARTKVPFVVPAHAYDYAQAHAVRRHDVCARGGVDAERPLCSEPGLESLFAPALRVLACVRIGIRRRGQSMTREQWLLAMVERLRPVFEERGIPLAKVWANDTLVRYAKVHFAQRGFRHWRSWSSRPLSVACHLKQK